MRLRFPARRCHGFTIVDLLVVLVALVVLAAILLSVSTGVRTGPNRLRCYTQMRTLHRGIVMYRDSHLHWRDDAFPYRLTMLKSIEYKESFLCRQDDSQGMQGGQPDDATGAQYAELDEHDKPGCLPLSYRYELSGAECSWEWRGAVGPEGGYFTDVSQIDSDGDGVASWGEVKWAQLRFGDAWLHGQGRKTYDPGKFPILRCFWHATETNSDRPVLNLAFNGNVYWSALPMVP